MNSKRRFYVPVFLIFLSVNVFATPSRNSDFTRALAIIASQPDGNIPPQVYPVLENVFRDSNSPEQRFRSALILAFAGNKNLKLLRRQYYARYCVENRVDAIPPKELHSLERIAADGFFDEAKLDEADKYYALLMTNGDPADTDYAIYKRGWLFLNEKEASHAFRTWVARIQLSNTTSVPISPELHDAIIRDTGRAWAETVPPIEDETDAMRTLALGPADRILVTEGIVAGLRRLSKTSDFEHFRQSLYQTDFAEPVLIQMLTTGTGFNQDACSLLNWTVAPVRFEQLASSDTLLILLNQCLRHGATKAQRIQIVDSARALALHGLARGGRAELLRAAGDHKAACGEFVAMANEVAESTEPGVKVLSEDGLQNLLYTCRTYLKNANVIPERDMLGEMFRLTENYARLGKLDSDLKNPLYALVLRLETIETYQNMVYDGVTHRPEVYRTTILPVLVAENITQAIRKGQVDSTIFPVIQDLLAKYAPIPLDPRSAIGGVWIELVRYSLDKQIKWRQWDKGSDLLSRYVPLSSSSLQKNPLVGELWTLWAISIPENDPAGTTQAMAFASHMLESIRPLSPLPTRQLTFALALKYGLIEEVWAHWSNFGFESGMASNLMARFLQQTFDHLNTVAQFSSRAAQEGLKASSHGRWAWVAAQVAKQRSLDDASSKSATEVLSASSGAFEAKGPVFLKDLSRVLQLYREGEHFSHSKLTFNGRLPREIERLFKTLDREIRSIQAEPWSDAHWLNLARGTAADNCTSVIDRLKAIRRPKELTSQQNAVLDEQIHSVVVVVEGWRSSLQTADVHKETS